MAIDGHARCLQVDNDPNGHAVLVAWRGRAYAARRIGIEASGGYERTMVAKPRMEGFEVIVFQPKQVRAYAMFRLQRAKPFGGLRK